MHRHLSALHRWASTALLAMLFMVLVPTVGRVYQSVLAVPTASEAMCTVTGLVNVAVTTPAHGQRPEAPTTGSHDDCAYCTLLSGLTALPLPPPVTMLALAHLQFTADKPSQVRLAFWAGRSLARGPPGAIGIRSTVAA